MPRHALLGAIALWVATSAPLSAQEATLKWKFKDGDKFYVEDSMQMKQTVSVLGQMQKVEQKSTTVTSYQILKVTTETITVKMKIEAVDVRSDAGISQFDKIMEKTKGAVFTVTIDPDGKVKKFEGFGEFAKKVGDGDEDVSKMLKQFITEDMFIQSIEQAFGFVPNKTVKKGDTWTRESKIPFGGIGEFKSSNTFTYNGKGDGGEMIGVKQNLSYIPPKAGTDFFGLFKIVKGNLKAENAKGTFVFDPEKGRLASGTSSMLIRGSLTLDLNGMEITVDVNVEQTGVSRVHDKNPIKDS